MHKTTSGLRKSFKLYAIAVFAAGVSGAAVALFAGVTPATAAGFAKTADAPIAAFMVPLTLLVFAILFEAARITWRGVVPKHVPAPRDARQYWRADQRQD